MLGMLGRARSRSAMRASSTYCCSDSAPQPQFGKVANTPQLTTQEMFHTERLGLNRVERPDPFADTRQSRGSAVVGHGQRCSKSIRITRNEGSIDVSGLAIFGNFEADLRYIPASVISDLSRDQVGSAV
jgi:hypothetical protein